MRRFPPERIICLTAETVETLYLLGEDRRIVGVSGFATRPQRVRREKPRISAFTSADIPGILALKPDLVLAFSDIQAGIAADLVRAGVAVHVFNQRDVAGILAMIRMLGAITRAEAKAEALARRLEARLAHMRGRAPARRPRVWFEEWNEPLVSGVKWVSELIEIAGGDNVFAHLADEPAAKDRIVTQEAARLAAPDVILGSWCGRKFQPGAVVARPGWSDVPAVASGRVFGIASSLILQPGPAALTEGLDAIRAALAEAE